MLKGVLGRVFGTRHEREKRRIQPIVDEINEHYARLQGVSEEELRGQTAKFRSIIHERIHELEEDVARLKLAKRTTSDPAERERVDNELSGADGRGGVEAKLREAISTASSKNGSRRPPRSRPRNSASTGILPARLKTIHSMRSNRWR